MSDTAKRRTILSIFFGTHGHLDVTEYIDFVRRYRPSNTERARQRHLLIFAGVVPFFAIVYITLLLVLGAKAPGFYRDLNNAIYPVTHAIASVIPYLWALEPSLVSHGYARRVPAILHIATAAVLFFLPVLWALLSCYKLWLKRGVRTLLREASVNGTYIRNLFLILGAVISPCFWFFIAAPSINYAGTVHSGRWNEFWHSRIHLADGNSIISIMLYYILVPAAIWGFASVVSVLTVAWKYRTIEYRRALFAKFERRRHSAARDL